MPVRVDYHAFDLVLFVASSALARNLSFGLWQAPVYEILTSGFFGAT
jgi:hypothetical protein